MSMQQQSIYCDEVMKFRKVLNLTSVRDKDVFLKTFIEPSVMLSQWINKGDIVLDVGSGMGVPGVPLSIHRPDVEVIMVERRKKRTEFIRHVIRKLKLHARAYDADIDDLPPLCATVCVARAVAEVSQLLRLCDKHIVTGGRAVLPVPDKVDLPCVSGWVLQDDIKKQGVQRIACYEKVKDCEGGVSHET